MDSAPAAEDTGSPAVVEWAGPDLSLPDCAGEDRSFASLARARGLVVAIGAAWCAPCQDDAPVLEAFGQQHPDVGIVQVLVQDGSGAPATSLTCAEWTEAFELSHAVLIDPVFATEVIAGDEGFPVHVAYGPAGDELYWEAGPFDAAEVENALTGS